MMGDQRLGATHDQVILTGRCTLALPPRDLPEGSHE